MSSEVGMDKKRGTGGRAKLRRVGWEVRPVGSKLVEIRFGAWRGEMDALMRVEDSIGAGSFATSVSNGPLPTALVTYKE